MRSGNPGALVILVRYMGHEVFERLLLHGLPGSGDRKDKAPAAYGIGLVPGLDHVHVGLGPIGGIPAHHHQLRPTRWDKVAHHLAKQGIFTAILSATLRQNEPAEYETMAPAPHRGHAAQDYGHKARQIGEGEQQFPEESKPQYSSRYPVWLFVNIHAIMRPSSEPCRSLHVGGCDGATCSHRAQTSVRRCPVRLAANRLC